MAETKTEKTEKKEGFFKNLLVEFKKIIWPTPQSAAKQVVLVIIATIILSILVSLLDSLITWLIGLIA